MAEKKKKDKYFHPCQERRRSFKLMVFYGDGIPGREAVAAKQRLYLLLSNNLKQEYLEMCGFIRDQMSLTIVKSNTLLLRGGRDKEACIQHILNLEDGAVMSLLDPWWG